MSGPRPEDAPAPAWTTAREALDAPPGLPPALYLRLDGPDGARAPGRFPVALEAGETLSLDTWFNHFPLPWWRAHGAPGPLAFEAALEGPGTVVLHARAPGAAAVALARSEVEGGTVRLPVPAAAQGRLWAEIRAAGPLRLRAARWAVQAAPRPVRLSLGLVAHDREGPLAETLAEALRAAQARPEIARIWLVNQGAPFADPELRRLAADPRVSLIEQANLGGCGGFVRTMTEALATPGLTHHLLMDDDIRLDGRMLGRAVDHLALLREPRALGGAMLDLRAPTLVHEAGAAVGRFGVIRPAAQGADLATAEGLAPFAALQPVEFNGWWFFALPLDALRAAGLPPPLFLRGDDLDLSRRLTAAGAPTATPPGLSVWHEPFYAKATSWQHYYDLRNRLIHAALHDPGDPPRALDVLERLLTPALSHDYATAEWRLLALRHFLGGPRALFARPPQEIHAEVAALAPGLRPQPLDAAPEGLPVIAQPPGPVSAAAHARGFALATLALAAPRREPFALVHEKAALPGATLARAHVRSDPAGTWFRLHAPRRRVALSLLARSLWASLRYRLRLRRALADWREGAEAARAPEAWARLFESPR
ncbi:glycosyltransferase [Albimonas pacifica]|uniref:Galactofuranosylgalactofuranosylrhamnosyl-N-acetylglucosaminyl-diphospho-decaprenol beta-1,5/1,6-galactofuranosyltransferase n=1 Tax=Albimonas pacifica TaxID=1114924 RepID=A0A1I3NGV8_9RHOB|nr:glycosyltransferase [Albimonas pacifica]SFJ08412.1 galactofuranosylgalactofuranosylrhamnosyl-N-acetylglucosaminyl-diphospho-decaprenol beta-1,5/1,6-galactofuranosyltransferase [Albimonas pacifica]